jgi:hypothetical protein
MSRRLVNAIFAVILIAIGSHNLVTGRGSLIINLFIRNSLQRPGQVLTGKWAVVEGLVFIGAGVFFFYRAWMNEDAGGNK